MSVVSEHIPHKSAKEELLRAARKVFAEKGYDAATIKDLAEEADVNVSLISYHFGGKENLFCECIEAFGKEKLALAEKLLGSPASLNSTEELKFKLKIWAEQVLESHVEDTEISTILHRDCFLNIGNVREIFKNTFVKIYEKLVLFFKFGQTKGFLRSDLDHFQMTTLFFGSIMHSARMDPMIHQVFGKTIQDPKYREALIETAIVQVFEGITKGKEK